MTMSKKPNNKPDSQASAGQPVYLHFRDGTFYFKRKIPVDVAKAFHPVKGAVWRSLGVGSVEDALGPLAAEVEEFNAKVAEARGKLPRERTVKRRPTDGRTDKVLLMEHIPVLLARYEHFMLENDDALRREMSREDRRERLEEFEAGLALLRDDAAAEDYSAVEDVMAQLLTDEGLNAPPGSKARSALLRELLWKDLELLEVQVDRLKGKRGIATPAMPQAPRELLTLERAFQHWQAGQTVKRTIDTYAKYVDGFETLCRALPIEAITPDHVNNYMNDLARDQGLAKETVKNHVLGLATLVTYSRQNLSCRLLSNPFMEVSFNALRERPASEDRRAFEIEELRILYNSPLYVQGKRPQGQAQESAYWAPLLGPFVGARIEEIAQLRIDDVQRVNGVWCLRIANLDENQHLKTVTSFRFVPMHEEVIRCGFLSYVAKKKVEGHTRVFPSQRNDNKHKIWSNALGKWHGRYLRQIGLSDPRLVYHSHRMLFKQRCTHCGVLEEPRDALTGHWISTEKRSGRGYLRTGNRQYPFPALVSAIAMLKYDELDLSHLYLSDPMAYVEEAFGVKLKTR